MLRILSLIVGLGIVMSASAATLVDPLATAPVLDRDHFRLELAFADAVTHKRGKAALPVTVEWWDGAWRSAAVKSDHLRGWDWRAGGDLSCDPAAGRLAGELVLTASRTGKDGEPVERVWTFGLDLALEAIDRVRAEPKSVEGRFWTVFPRSQGERFRVAGKAVGSGVFVGETSVRGVVGPPHEPGHWSMGTVTDGGLAWLFAMGDERRTWNHVRLAQLTFAAPQDLSAVEGLRLRVATTAPRNDVELSVWLREGDGSWYYIKKAVPLVQAINDVVLTLDDFSEAEWVAPGSHMDEDYVFDRSAVSHLAIGVVNSLGVGDVRCRLLGVETADRDVEPLGPATATVSGELLSVNGHDIVPAGLFGGYAPHLPDRYRPGCQRDLYPPSYPRIPRQQTAKLSTGAYRDWPGFVRVLQGKVPEHQAFAAHCASLLAEERDWSRLRQKYDLAKELAKAEKRGRKPKPPRQLERLTTRLLRDPAFYQADTWPAITLDEHLEQALAQVRAGEANDTERMELHRDLLALAFPELIKPRPAYGPTEIFQVDCYGERLHPATMLTNSNWQQQLEGFGRTYASNAAKGGYGVRLEFWNEPYLNWAERSRVNLKGKYYKTDGIKAGDPVQIRWKQRDGTVVDGPVVPHFQWVADGKGGLKVVDTTAFSYFAGRGNGWIYDQMLKAMGQGIKAGDPTVPVIGGWGFRWHEDHWAAWPLLYKPTIDNNIDWIDGIHEHHYQGDTTAMNGSYEVLVAYGVTAHQKWLHCYNTETNDLVDAPARGIVDTPEKARRATQYRRMVYNLRDCLYCVQESPDKIQSRTVIHYDHTREAIEVAYGLMKDLRGRLVYCPTSEPDVWAVASIDGSDPASPPPEPGLKLVAFLYNDHRSKRTIEWTLRAPTGTSFAGDGELAQITVDPATFALGVDRSTVAVDGDAVQLSVTLPPRLGARVVIPLEGTVPEASDRVRRQYFSPDILQRITAEDPFATTVVIPEDELAGAKAAWLRLVVEDVAEGEAAVTVNGREFMLPKRLTADNINAIVMLPLPLDALQADNAIAFRLADPAQAAYRVDMVSIVVDR